MTSIYIIFISVMVSIYSGVTWVKLTTKAPSPVDFQPLQTPYQAFWLAAEYGPQALSPRPNRKQRAAIALDRALRD